MNQWALVNDEINLNQNIEKILQQIQEKEQLLSAVRSKKEHKFEEFQKLKVKSKILKKEIEDQNILRNI